MKRDVLRPKTFEGLLSKSIKSDRHALAKLLTFIERDLPSSLKALSKLKMTSDLLKLGITGPPGAGKSSLINLLIKTYRSQKKRVAVLAVDPSSPFSGGALLGDRIRMGGFSNDKDVFIRSVGSRGTLGGLSAATGAMSRVFGLCDFDILIIETVGVGQTELNIMNLSDVTAVVLVPESGDVVQTLKAGILEIADLFIVNKSDRPGSEILARELNSLVEQEGLKRREIFLTSALKKTGVDELSKKILKLAKELKSDKTRQSFKAKGELHALISAEIENQLTNSLKNLTVTDVYEKFSKIRIPRIKIL
jgi:LAO/AO transport system kinase